MDSSDKYLLGKNTKITYESLQSNLWTIEDIRSRINMNGADKPVAEKDLKEFEEQIKNKQIIIETVNKEEEEDGESIHDLSTVSQLSLQNLRNNQ